MRSMPRWSLLCLLSILLLPAGGAAGAQYEAHIHFLVVPQTAAPGLSYPEAMEDFQGGLARLAGGYTELGFSQGATMRGGKLRRGQNVSFLVYAPRDLTAERQKLISKYFATNQPFVLHWKGTSTFPPGR